jgi:hypothetical protein
MPRHPKRPARPHRPAGPAGIAVAAACDGCAHLIGSPEPGEHGGRLAIMHIGHVAELEELGWILTYPDDDLGQPPDITCEHYHQANWQGGHDGCCGKRDGDPDGPRA